MERRFRTRLNELLGDAEVHPGLLRGMAPRLAGFVRPFAECLGSDARRRNAAGYVEGLLSNLGAKTAEAIAYHFRLWREYVPPAKGGEVIPFPGVSVYTEERTGKRDTVKPVHLRWPPGVR